MELLSKQVRSFSDRDKLDLKKFASKTRGRNGFVFICRKLTTL